ncbi:malonyl-CoA-acyl carrier protein transacylase [Homo sapiens]|nr:malonyl-CoA-acyl carrier protein transacylase [Homo sapiens]KAI4003324.1 malonyl-CoA-acyl carrier protein transacylase [Homo sapiens]
MAAVEKLHHLQPSVIENCVAAAGFSVGEFAALVFAGAMEFAEGTGRSLVLCKAVVLGSLGVRDTAKNDTGPTQVMGREHMDRGDIGT